MLQYPLYTAELLQQPSRGLRPNTGDTRNIIGAVARQSFPVGQPGRWDVVFFLYCGWIVQLRISYALKCCQDFYPVSYYLEEVPVASDHHDIPAFLGGLVSHRANNVVGFIAFLLSVCQAQRLNQFVGQFKLGSQLLIHRRPARLILLKLLMPEGRSGRVKSHQATIRALLGQQANEHLGQAIDGIGRLAGGGREGGQGVISPMQQAIAVN